MAIAGIQGFQRDVWFLNLDRRVIDMESLACQMSQPAQYFRAASDELVISSNDMATHRHNSRCERPDVQVVNGPDAIDLMKLFSQ